MTGSLLVYVTNSIDKPGIPPWQVLSWMDGAMMGVSQWYVHLCSFDHAVPLTVPIFFVHSTSILLVIFLI